MAYLGRVLGGDGGKFGDGVDFYNLGYSLNSISRILSN
jgi:hypothetical protein